MGTVQSDTIIQSKPRQQESAVLQKVGDVAAQLVCVDPPRAPHSMQRLFSSSSAVPQPGPGHIEVPVAQAVLDATIQKDRRHRETPSSGPDHQRHVRVQPDCRRWATSIPSISLAQPRPLTRQTLEQEIGKGHAVDTLALAESQCRRRAEVLVPPAKMEDRFVVNQQDARIESLQAMASVSSSITVPSNKQKSADVQVGKQEFTGVQADKQESMGVKQAKLPQDIRSSIVGTVTTGKQTNLSQLTSAKQTRSQQISTPPVCNAAHGMPAVVTQPPSLRHSSGTQQVCPPVLPASSCEPLIPVVPRNDGQPTHQPMTPPAEGTCKSHQGFVGRPANPPTVHRLPPTYGNSYGANAHSPSPPPAQPGFSKISAPVLSVSISPLTSTASAQVRKQESKDHQGMKLAQHPGASPMGIMEPRKQLCHSPMPFTKQQRLQPVSPPIVCKVISREPVLVFDKHPMASGCGMDAAAQTHQGTSSRSFQRPSDSLLSGPAIPLGQSDEGIYSSHQEFTSGPANPAAVSQLPPTNSDVCTSMSPVAVQPPPQPGGTQKPNLVSQVIQPHSVPVRNHPGVQPSMYPAPLLLPTDVRDHKKPAPYGQNPLDGPATIGQPWRSGEYPPVAAPASYLPNTHKGSVPDGRPAHCFGVNDIVQPPRVPVSSPTLPDSSQHSGCQQFLPPPNYSDGDPPGGPSEPFSSLSSVDCCGVGNNSSPPSGPPQNAYVNLLKTPRPFRKPVNLENLDYLFQRVALVYRWVDREKLNQLSADLQGKASPRRMLTLYCYTMSLICSRRSAVQANILMSKPASSSSSLSRCQRPEHVRFNSPSLDKSPKARGRQ